MEPVEKQTTEVRETNVQQGNTNVNRQTVSQTATADSRVVAQRIVWYIVGVIVVLLLLRLVMQLLGANTGNAFVDLIYTISGIFAAPFFGIFSYQPAYGVSFFEVSTLVAIVVYVLLGWGIAKLFTLNSASPEA